MKQLIFGDPESIAYRDAKEIASLEYFDYHDCNCDFCENKGYIECPYCKDICDPGWISMESPLNICDQCGKKAFSSYQTNMNNDKIINNFEKK
jgi:hypothetical protein